jgi:hypothetical protein
VDGAVHVSLAPEPATIPQRRNRRFSEEKRERNGGETAFFRGEIAIFRGKKHNFLLRLTPIFILFAREDREFS